MTREQAREAAAVMLGWADGKEVHYINKIGLDRTLRDCFEPVFNWHCFDYRLKPTATLRPWTADEVPLGAWMRNKTNPQYRFIMLDNSTPDGRVNLFNHSEHSTDGGKTWLPCGVEEVGK